MNAAQSLLRPALEQGYGSHAALIFHDRTYSYDEVARAINRAGNALREFGIVPDDRVLIMLRDSPDFVFCYLGAIKIGAVAVAVNLRASPRDLLFYLRDTQATVFVLERNFIETYRTI